MDLSQIPTEQLQSIVKGNSQSNSPDLSNLDTDTLKQIASKSTSSSGLSPIGESIASAASQIPGIQTIANKLNNTGIEEIPTSLGAGIQSGIANTVGNAVGASPQSTQSLSAPSITSEARADYPRTNVAGQVIGAVTPAIGATMATGGTLGSLMGTGLLTDMAANGIAGAALAGPGNRTTGAVLGAATAPISSMVSNVGGFVVKASTIGNKVKQFVSNINSSIPGTPGEVASKSQANVWKAASGVEDKLFSSFREAPGTIDAQATVTKASEFLGKYSKNMDSTQRGIIQDFINNTSDAKSLGDLHDARKALSFDYNKFNAAENPTVSNKMFQDFKGLQNTSESVLRNNAESLGVGNQFKEANDYFKNTIMPLKDAGAKDTYDLLSDTRNPMSAAQRTDTLIQKYIKPNKPEVAKQFLSTLDDTGRSAVETHIINKSLQSATMSDGAVDFLKFKNNLQTMQTSLPGVFSDNTNSMIGGLNKTIDEASHVLGLEVNTAKIGTTSKLYLGLGAASAVGGLGYAEGGKEGMGLGLMTVGLGLGLHQLIKTPVGQNLLIRAGTKGGAGLSKQIVNGILLQGALMANPSNPNNQGGQ